MLLKLSLKSVWEVDDVITNLYLHWFGKYCSSSGKPKFVWISGLTSENIVPSEIFLIIEPSFPPKGVELSITKLADDPASTNGKFSLNAE